MPTYKSGKNGKIAIGASDLSEVRNWSFTLTANISKFGSSGTAGHGTTVTGRKDANGSFDLVLDTDDPWYGVFKVGDEVTLLLHEDATRKWTFPATIESVPEECDINDGGEIMLSGISWQSRGAFTYPDSTVSV